MIAYKWKKGTYVGKYKLLRKMGDGGFAVVFHAHDVIQGIDVALKLPKSDADDDDLDDLEQEVKIVSQLDHPNILAIKNADYVYKNVLAVATPLGLCSLDDRMEDLSTQEILDITEQLLRGLAHAHEKGILHCDIKPENIICFEHNHFKLGDFGLAKAATKTAKTSNPGGTLGYMAPEHAMGQPAPRSDVFSVGVLIYELIVGELPEWPFEWPLPGYDKIKACVPELVDTECGQATGPSFLQRALHPNGERYAHAGAMLSAFLPLKQRALARLSSAA